MNYKVIASGNRGMILILLLGLTLFTFSCGKSASKADKYSFYESTVDTSKPIAWGNDRDIYIFCDNNDWKYLQELMKRSLERELFVVTKEKYFNIIRGDIKEIDSMMKYKNLLFMGSMKSRAPVSMHLRDSMDRRMLERIQNSGGEMFVAKNRWVKDQLVVYVIGSSQENLLKLNILQAERLFNLLVERLGERLAYQAYQTKLIPEEFFDLYPFTLKIPENYKLFNDDKKNRFLSLLYRFRSEARDFPDKYISVYYQDMPADSLTLDWIMTKRKELAYKYYDKDEFDPKMLRSERLEFSKYKAWRIMGPWVNKTHDIGGGFQTFAFYDEAQKRAYLIDNVVYFPAGDKLPVLLELEKISATFKTK